MVSAWAIIDTFSGAPQLIVSKGYEHYFLRSTYFPSIAPSWEFAEFHESNSWHSTRSPANSGEWVLLTGVRYGSSQFLYCNGIVVDRTEDVWPRDVQRNTDDDLSLGGFLREVTIPDEEGYCFLDGSIDEVRIESIVRSNDWITLCYMNQRTDDRLVTFE